MPTPTTPLPTEIKIIGKTYKVESVPEMDDDCGACYDSKQLIKISEDIPQELSQDTLLHEVMHAIDYQMHINMKERQISAMASGLTAVFKENPDFVKYFLGTNVTKMGTKAAPTKHKRRK
jgi:hypothetical protein